MLLRQKNIVIIGGTGGLGISAAKAFVANGANLVLTGNDADALDGAASLGSNVRVLESDARAASSAAAAVELCVQTFGSLDGLYHVAGGSGRKMGDGPLHDMTLEAWNKTLELNLTSVMLSNRAAVQQFLLQPEGGSILNMGSVLGFSPSPVYFGTHAYAAAKSAIWGFSKSIASYYARNNIRVNCIAPALIETPMSARALHDEAIQSYIRKKQPLGGGRMGLAEEVDGLAVYFMSHQSKFVTGQCVSVDGGWSISESI